MTTLTPWALGPFEILLHAEMHYREGEDFDRRIAIVGFDNSIELSIHTYLSLHPIQRQNRAYPKSDCERWLENFHTKIDFFETEIQTRKLTMVCDKGQFIWYHDIRSGQYHVGGATIPPTRELDGIRKAAIWVFGVLFDIADVEALFDQYIAARSGDDLPRRNGESDRLIDREYGMVELAGKTYYLSEVLHAFDAVEYSELANDIRKRDASNDEMNQKGDE